MVKSFVNGVKAVLNDVEDKLKINQSNNPLLEKNSVTENYRQQLQDVKSTIVNGVKAFLNDGEDKLQNKQLNTPLSEINSITENYRQQLQDVESALRCRNDDIAEYHEAISIHAPELLTHMQQRVDYRSLRNKYYELISQLNEQCKKRLEELNNLSTKQFITTNQELQQYKELVEEKNSTLQKNKTEIFEQLTVCMSDLLYSFFEVLLASKEKTESPLPYDKLNLASQIDIMNIDKLSGQPSTTDVVDLLNILLQDRNLPKQCKHQLIGILIKIKFSALNIPFALYALNETIKSISEDSVQASVRKIINKNLNSQIGSGIIIKALIDELQFRYLENFMAFFNSFINLDKSNQQIIDEIDARLTAIESHALSCEALKGLVANYRYKLEALQWDAINDPKIENHNKLGEQLTKFKNELETGAYFKSIQEAVKIHLNKLKINFNLQIDKDYQTVEELQLSLRNGSALDEELSKLQKIHFKKVKDEIKKWDNAINNYLKKNTLNEIMKFDELNVQETNACHMPMQIYVAKLRFLSSILMARNSDVKIAFTELDFLQSRPNIPNLIEELFTILNGVSTEKIYFLKQLGQFFEEEEQHSEPICLFKKMFRQSILEKCLNTIFKPQNSLSKTHELLDDSTTEEQLIYFIAPPDTKRLFMDIKNSLRNFMDCNANINRKKNSYAPSFFHSFFLKKDESKRIAVAELIVDLSLNSSQDILEEKFMCWEAKHCNTIDSPRYRSSIINQLMVILHSIQTLLSGKVFETETRKLVNLYKNIACETSKKLNDFIPNLTMRSL